MSTMPLIQSTDAGAANGQRYINASPAARLSSRQRDILRRLLAASVCRPGENEPAPPCVSIKGLRGSGPKSAADSAAFSRTVRRLARRELVIPCNLTHGVRSGPNAGKVNIDATDKNTRATHLLLTPLGRAIASRMQNKPVTGPESKNLTPNTGETLANVPNGTLGTPSQAPAPGPVPTPPIVGRKCSRCPQEALAGGRFCDSCRRMIMVLSPLWDGK